MAKTHKRRHRARRNEPRRRRRRVAHNPLRRRHYARRNEPRRRKRARRYAFNPRRRYRRNPDGIRMGFLWDATYVTSGFLLGKVTAGFVLPMIGVQQPILRIASKGVLAWGLGWVSGMAVGRRNGNLIMLGAFVDVLNDVVKTYVAPFVPALAAGEVESVPGVSDADAYYTGQSTLPGPGMMYREHPTEGELSAYYVGDTDNATF